MTMALLVGTAMGIGLALVGRAFFGPERPLVALIAGIERPRLAASESVSSSPWQRLVGKVAGAGLGRRAHDLAVLDRSPERHAVERLGVAVVFGTLVLLVAVAVTAAGVHGAAGPAIVAALVAVPVGYWLPELTVRSQAGARRQAVVTSLSSYLDLVAVLLAGGTGTETALTAAAEAGDSWTFQRIRDALTVARTTRRSPWQGLAALGEEIAVDELVEIASTVQLAGEQGARVTATLTAKASAMRAAQLARAEAEANAATEQMSLPTVMLFLGFLALLGYPAMHLVLEGFG